MDFFDGLCGTFNTNTNNLSDVVLSSRSSVKSLNILNTELICLEYILEYGVFVFRLISDRGLPALRTLFDNVRFKGKGHEVRTALTEQRMLAN